MGAGALFGWGRGLLSIGALGLGAAGAVFLAIVMCDGWSLSMSYLTARDTGRELPSPVARGIVRGELVAAVVVAAVVVAAVAVIAAALFVGWRLGISAGAAHGGFVGLGTGLLALVRLGGYAVVEQVVVGLILHRRGLLPLPGRPFLRYATQCLFLRCLFRWRVGDAYLFAHLSLRECLAGM